MAILSPSNDNNAEARLPPFHSKNPSGSEIPLPKTRNSIGPRKSDGSRYTRTVVSSVCDLNSVSCLTNPDGGGEAKAEAITNSQSNDLLAGASLTNTENSFINSNVDFTAASGWLQRLVRRIGCNFTAMSCGAVHSERLILAWWLQ